MAHRQNIVRRCIGRLLFAIMVMLVLGFIPIFSPFGSVAFAQAAEAETGAEAEAEVQAMAEDSAADLYTRLGEIAGITQFVDDFLSDERMGISFAHNNLKRFRVATTSHMICHLADGPCQYGGPEIEQLLTGLGVSYTDIYIALQPLEDSFYHAGVSLEDKDTLFGLLLPAMMAPETAPNATE